MTEVTEWGQFQFVNWFPEWQGIAFVRLDPNRTDMALIYVWYLCIAFWEIRKWRVKYDRGTR